MHLHPSSGRKVILFIAMCLGLGLMTTPAIAGGQSSRFNFMFKDLKPFTSPSNQQLADLAQTMLDPNLDSENNPDPEMTSGYTYLGQFLDHDLTLDTSDNPDAPVDPTQLESGRTFKLDLDSVYGGGPDVSPELYSQDHKHLKVQKPNVNGVIDLPRKANGTAILAESRNDENQIIAQMHVVFIEIHNRLADTMSFEQAQRTLILHYQSMVLFDFLPHTIQQSAIDAVLNNPDQRFYKPGNGAPFVPLEFSVAAYRLGHSQVRSAYEVNDTSGEIPVFATTGPDLRGGVPIQSGRQIDWGNFLDEFTDAADVEHLNQSRKLDPLISESLFNLPIPGAEANGSNILAFRNFTRAKFYGLPSGQTVATAMGIKPIPAGKFGDLGSAFTEETPLWYYILGEAEMTTDGQTLGPVGSRIVAEGFIGALEADPQSILHQDFAPLLSIVPGGAGEVDIADLFEFSRLPGTKRVETE